MGRPANYNHRHRLPSCHPAMSQHTLRTGAGDSRAAQLTMAPRVTCRTSGRLLSISTPLLAVLGAVAVAALLPYTPLAGPLGFTRLPAAFLAVVAVLAVLAVLVAAYLALVEAAKYLLFAPGDLHRRLARPAPRRHRPVHRRAARFSVQLASRPRG
jgi:hypothetical protein